MSSVVSPHELSWGDLSPVRELLDRLGDTVFFIKDRSGRYVATNDTLLVRCGLARRSQLIGKLPSDVLGPGYGRSYEAQDRQVLETGATIVDQLELHTYASRSIGWCLTTKLPIREAGGRIIGLTGISKDLRQPDLSDQHFAQLSPVVAFIDQNLSNPPTINELSNMSSLTPFQLDRRIRKVYGLSTGQWILKRRIDYARELLMATTMPIADVALSAGYSDQSAFSRQFRKTTGFSPSQFRELH